MRYLPLLLALVLLLTACGGAETDVVTTSTEGAPRQSANTYIPLILGDAGFTRQEITLKAGVTLGFRSDREERLSSSGLRMNLITTPHRITRFPTRTPGTYTITCETCEEGETLQLTLV